VIRVKRDRALALAVAEIAARDPGIRDDDTDAAPVRSRAFARRADLQHLFGDRALLERVVGASEGRLHARMIEDVLGHSFVQFSDTAEKEFAHVDKERLVTVDGLSIDEGTAMGDARTIDAEDYAVLFEIDRLRAQARGGVPTLPGPYDCIVLDEAQELAPLELALIGRSARGTIIVAGDADQQTDATVSFEGWDSTMRALGVASYETATLEIGYRCPPDVVAFARSILAGRAAPCTLVPFDSERALGEWLAREIAEITHNDRQALLGVVCRHALTARRIKALVGREARIVWDGRFPPAGAFVTTVDQVKGLELDHVVVPDANAAAYPDEPAARRALYVAATRARHQLVLAAVGASSPILGTSRTSHM
jgi:hypothetical protein